VVYKFAHKVVCKVIMGWIFFGCFCVLYST